MCMRYGVMLGSAEGSQNTARLLLKCAGAGAGDAVTVKPHTARGGWQRGRDGW